MVTQIVMLGHKIGLQRDTTVSTGTGVARTIKQYRFIKRNRAMLAILTVGAKEWILESLILLCVSGLICHIPAL